MSEAPSEPLTPSIGRELALVAAMTLVGLVVRIWALGRLGLVHFDEGIYALSGLWALSPGGIADLDPVLIPYAPPGFPVLVGLSYGLFGASDLSAILVSIIAGTLAVPASAWLAHRTFGPGAGPPAAALAALSGFHVAFSRMALTDASFLLCWLVGLIFAQRFLERPGVVSGVLLGLAVGVAQLFKYSGWTLGAAVPLAVIAIAVCDESRRTAAYQYRAWGFGVVAAGVAALVYAPWFWFVENHGGYRGLMVHHSGYMGSLGSWVPHWRTQLEEMSALSGLPGWTVAGWLTAVGVAAIMRVGKARPGRAGRWLMFLAASFTIPIAPTMLWWLGLVWLVFPGRDASPGRRLLGVAWVGLSILTPFYHPYARLWLPIQALGWIAGGGLLAELLAPAEARTDRAGWRLPLLIACCLAAFFQAGVTMRTPGANERGAGVLASSDSLRLAVNRVIEDLPRRVSGLRLLARPPVTFYIGGRVGTRVEPDLEGLMRNDGSGAWALVDLAQLRQSGDVTEASSRLLERWEKVEVYPTTLNLPTLLDVDPSAARTARPDEADAPLWLLRPRRTGAPE